MQARRSRTSASAATTSSTAYPTIRSAEGPMRAAAAPPPATPRSRRRYRGARAQREQPPGLAGVERRSGDRPQERGGEQRARREHRDPGHRVQRTEPDIVAMPSRARIAAMTSRIEGTTRSPVARATTAPYPSVATSPTVPSPMYSGGQLIESGRAASRTSVVTATSPSPRPASAAANARPSSATSRPSPGRMASARASRFTWGGRVTVVRGGARGSTNSDGPGSGRSPSTR